MASGQEVIVNVSVTSDRTVLGGLAGACYDGQRDRGLDHDAALRALSNRLVGILHGCLKTRTLYDEATAWSHRTPTSRAA